MTWLMLLILSAAPVGMLVCAFFDRSEEEG